MSPNRGTTYVGVSATLAIAIIGAVTGIAGLVWQMASFGLTGARIEIFATAYRKDEDGSWYIASALSNVGRLDASVVGYTVWVDQPGHRLRRAKWKLGAALKRHRLRRGGRRPLVVFSPMVHIGSPGSLQAGDSRIEFPRLLKAGEMVWIPEVGMSRDDDPDGHLLRVAVHLGSGLVVKARPLSLPELEPPLEIKGQQSIRIF